MNNSPIATKFSRANFSLVIVLTALLAVLAIFIQNASASEALVNKYQELAKSKGMSFTYDNLAQEGDGSFTLYGISLNFAGVEDPVKIKSITLSEVKELTGIGLSAELINLIGLSWDGRNKGGQEVVITLGSGKMEGFYFPDPSDLQAPLFIFERYALEVNEIAVSIDGNSAIEIPSAVSEFIGTQNFLQYDGTVQIANIDINPDAIPDGGKLRQQLSILGYDALDLSIDVAASWNLETGDLSLSKYEVAAANIGAIDFQINFGGYTHTFAKELRAIDAEIQALPADQRIVASQKVMGHMSNLTVDSMTISFRDDSITDKVVALQAQAMGQPPENMKAILPSMLSGALAGLQKPELAAKIVTAAEAFLASPGTISISANPDAPVAMSELVGLAMSVPAVLIDRLKLDVQAR